ncbi:MAG: YdcF family protein [Bacteroidetes bacterium]|nr:YdcF family protein [Bacteroidota bacterium]
MKKPLYLVLLLLFLSVGFFVLRHPILRSFVTFLIHEDSLQHADVMIVLSGGGFDRGNEAAKVYEQGFAPRIICTGGNPVIEMKVFGIDTLESDMTAANLRHHHIPDSVIIELREGTSTKEEAAVILNYCQSNAIKRVILITSLLHTGRARNTFYKQLHPHNIEVMMHGAPSSRFDEMYWWQSEDGLIAVNNEWIKQLYYWIKIRS